jgi:hypothetical protein
MGHDAVPLYSANPSGFVCDSCRYRHEFMRDEGKTFPVEQGKHEEGQSCTGRLCRRCTYGDMNRAERRANPDASCISRCR